MVRAADPTRVPDIAAPLSLPPHRLRVAVLQPQIAPNTGNIARLCVATGTELHLVRPMGFVLDDRELKRKAVKTSTKGVLYVDYKDTETLRRLMSGNGKMQSRRRTGASAMEQRLIAVAIKRARFMGFLPFVEATA